MAIAFTQRTGALNKIPVLTFGFWMGQVGAAMLGETGTNAVFGAPGADTAFVSACLVGALLALVLIQISAARLHSLLFWAAIVVSAAAGSNVSALLARLPGFGFAGVSALLLGCELTALGIWLLSEGTISVERLGARRAELFYWVTIALSQTLGASIGAWIAQDVGLDYFGGVLVLAVALAIVGAVYFFTLSKAVLFWVALVLTRAVGGLFGDFLTNDVDQGGLAWSCVSVSLGVGVLMTVLVLALPQRAARSMLGRSSPANT